MPDIHSVIQELHTAAKSLISVCNGLRSFFTQEAGLPAGDAPPTEEIKPELPKETPKKTKELTYEKVRAVLADKSRNGFTDEIRDLLGKYGCKKFSEVSPEHYPELLKDAEALK
jgi:hypothetical protein